MSGAFDRWLAFLLPHEGSETNDPDDHGGRTKFGISKAANPDVDLDTLTEAQALVLMWDRYWVASSADEIEAVAPRLAIAVADYGFHSGPPSAVRELQRVVGSLPDGQVGVRTLGALGSVLRNDGEAVVVQRLNDRRRARLRRLAESPSQAKYLKGWLRRVDDLDALLSDDKPS